MERARTSFGQMRIRVTFKALFTGEFTYNLLIKNRNDYTNDIVILQVARPPRPPVG